MTDDALMQVERELVRAARRRAAARPRLYGRRGVVLAAGLAAILVVVPAWATGLLGSVFPSVKEPLSGPGPTYLVASGVSQRGERWRFELMRGPRFHDARSTSPRVACWILVVGGPRSAHGVCEGGGPGVRGGFGSALGAVGTERRVSPRDLRQYSEILVPRSVAIVEVRFRRAPALAVRPLSVDQRRARATGVLFPYGYVGFAYPAGDRIRGVSFLDAKGRPLHIGRSYFPQFSAPRRVAGRVVRSPAL